MKKPKARAAVGEGELASMNAVDSIFYFSGLYSPSPSPISFSFCLQSSKGEYCQEIRSRRRLKNEDENRE
jgi:hypothetical protein